MLLKIELASTLIPTFSESVINDSFQSHNFLSSWVVCRLLFVVVVLYSDEAKAAEIGFKFCFSLRPLRFPKRAQPPASSIVIHPQRVPL